MRIIGTGIEFANFEGVCAYCGSMQPILAADRTDADRKVTEACECGGHEKAQRRKQIMESLDSLFGKKCESTIFSPVSAAQMELLKAAADAVLDEVIDAASINLGETQGQLSRSVKGSVKIARKFGTKAQAEV